MSEDPHATAGEDQLWIIARTLVELDGELTMRHRYFLSKKATELTVPAETLEEILEGLPSDRSDKRRREGDKGSGRPASVLAAGGQSLDIASPETWQELIKKERRRREGHNG